MALTIEEVIDQVSKWLELPGIEMVGEGEADGEPIILVYVSVDPAALKDILPKTYEGFPVVVEWSGPIWALES